MASREARSFSSSPCPLGKGCIGQAHRPVELGSLAVAAKKGVEEEEESENESREVLPLFLTGYGLVVVRIFAAVDLHACFNDLREEDDVSGRKQLYLHSVEARTSFEYLPRRCSPANIFKNVVATFPNGRRRKNLVAVQKEVLIEAPL